MHEFKEPIEGGRGDLTSRVKDVLEACRIIDDAFLKSSQERQLKIGDFFKHHSRDLNKLQASLRQGKINPEERAKLEKICQSLEDEYLSDDFLSG